MDNDFELFFPGQEFTSNKQSPQGDFDVVMPTKPEERKDPAEDQRRKDMERGPINKWVNAALRGATFGLSDRAIAKGRDLFDEGDNYSKHLEDQFAQRDALNADSPWLAGGAEVLGSLATGGFIGGIAKGALSAAAPRAAAYAASKGVIPAAIRGAEVLGGGAIAGGVNGAAQAEQGHVLEGGAKGAALGSVTAGGLNMAGKALKGINNRVVSPLMGKVGSATGAVDPDKWAQRQLVESLSTDSSDLATVAKKMRELDPDGSRGLMLGEVAGINTANRIKGATVPPTVAKNDLAEKLVERDQKAPFRLMDDISKSVSARSDSYNVADEIYELAKKQAAPHYDKLKNLGPIDDPRLHAWFEATPGRQELLKDWVTSEKIKGNKVADAWHVDEGGFLSKVKAPEFETLKQIKEFMGRQRDTLWDAEKGMAKPDTANMYGAKYSYGDLSNEFKSFRDVLDEITIDPKTGVSIYKEARGISGDASEINKAIALGRKITSAKAEEFAQKLKEVESPAELEALRVGAASALVTTLGKAKGGSTAANSVYGSPEMQKKLQMIFKDSDAKAIFEKAVQAEKTAAKGNRELAPRVSVQSEMMNGGSGNETAVGSAIADAASGRASGLFRSLGRMFSNQWEQSQKEYAEPLLRYGMMGADEVERLAQQLAAKQQGRVMGGLSAAGRAMQSSIPYAGAAQAGDNAEGYDPFRQ